MKAFICGLLTGFLISGVICFFVGQVSAEAQIYSQLSQVARITIQRAFANKNVNYKNIEIVDTSNGSVYLNGVSSRKEYESMRHELNELFGRSDTERMLSGVTILDDQSME